jgi:carbon-monoxide dehydrogenase medium subunit
MVTQAAIIAHAGLAAALPILGEAALQIADPQVRNRSTIGGNAANGDPGNDMPAVLQALGASFELLGPGGSRSVAARDFYQGFFATSRADDEILTRIVIPLPGRGTGMAYEKQKRKTGDYATAAAAVVLSMAGGRCTGAAVAMTNLAPKPVFVPEAGAALTGSDLGKPAVAAAVAAMQAAIDPAADMKGPVEFKRHLAGVILARAIARAAARAG